MSFLLIGERPDVLLIKYKLLNRNSRLNIQQCYSFKSAEEKLKQSSFDCVICSLFPSQNTNIQYWMLGKFNQKFQVPIKVWQGE